MENENQLLDEDVIMNERPAIYSKRAIRAFSILITPIFGGVMLMQNLRDIDRKGEANKVLLFSIIYTIMVYSLASIPSKPGMFTLILNVIGAMILCDYAFKNHFPDENEYPKKKVWKPLILAVVLTAFAIWGLLQGMNQLN